MARLDKSHDKTINHQESTMITMVTRLIEGKDALDFSNIEKIKAYEKDQTKHTPYKQSICKMICDLIHKVLMQEFFHISSCTWIVYMAYAAAVIIPLRLIQYHNLLSYYSTVGYNIFDISTTVENNL